VSDDTGGGAETVTVELPLDTDAPYADVDLTDLPAWWRRAVEHFRDRGLSAYRPPRFADGTLEPELVDGLESALDVSITFQCKNASVGDEWTVVVDGEPVGTIGRHRSRDRYTVYEMTGQEFADWIRSVSDSSASDIEPTDEPDEPDTDSSG
jgi:hypothetical protein